MTRFRAPLLLAAILVLAALVAGTASAKPKSWAFSATITGTATEKVDGQAVTATAKGKGKVSLIGMSTMSGVVNATTANPPCSPFNGPGHDRQPEDQADRDRPPDLPRLRGGRGRPERHLDLRQRQGLQGDRAPTRPPRGRSGSPATTTARAAPSP